MAITKFILISGAVFAGLGVALGAFGAHALENMVTPNRLETFETGVRYQMYHAFALLILGALVLQPSFSKAPYVTLIAWLFIIGILIFSGSLYLLVLTDTAWLGAITPIGGVAFIAGWGMLILSIMKASG